MEGHLSKINEALQCFNGRVMGPASVMLTAMNVAEGNDAKLAGAQKAQLADQLVPYVVQQAKAAGLLNDLTAQNVMNIYQSMRPWFDDIREAIIIVSKLPALVQKVETEVKGCAALCKKK